MVSGRIENHLYLSIDYGRNFDTQKMNNLIGLGYGSDRCVILFKVGQDYSRISTVDNMYFESRLDYGVEYLWLLDTTKKYTMCYGMAYTKWSGVQIKLGTSF